MALEFLDSVLDEINSERKSLWPGEVSVKIRSAGARESLSDSERAVLSAEIAVWDFRVCKGRTSRWGTYYGPALEAKQDDGTDRIDPDITLMDASVLARWQARLLGLDHPALVARYADVLWDLTQTIAPTAVRDCEVGQKAIDAYQQVVQEGLSRTPTLELQRALDIATEMNDVARTNTVCEALLALSERAEAKQIGIWTAAAAAFEGKRKISEAHHNRMIQGMETRLAAAASVPDGYAAQCAGDALLRNYKRNVNLDDRNRVLRTIADTYLRQSQGADPGVAISWLSAIAPLLEKEGLHDVAESLRLEMERRGPEAIAGMKTLEVETSIPMDELNAQLDGWISGANPLVALVRLVHALIPKCDRLRARVKEHERQFAFYSLIPRAVIGRDGIPVATIGNSKNDMDGRMMEEVMHDIQLNPMFFSLGMKKIEEKYGFTIEQLVDFAMQSSLVTSDMSNSLTEALIAYEAFDYSKSVSLLIPQIEGMLRQLLKLLGVPIRKGIRNSDGASELKNMNDVLSDGRIIDVMDENLLFFLRAVFIDKRGLNLRNEFAHGDIPSSGFNETTGSLTVMSFVALSSIGPHTMYQETQSATEGDAP